MLEKLKPRELEVLALIAQGCSNKEIGEKLHIAEATAREYSIQIYEKFELTNTKSNPRVKAILIYLDEMKKEV